MSTTTILLVIIVVACLVAVLASVRARALRMQLRRAGSNAPVDTASGLVAGTAGMLRLRMEIMRASRVNGMLQVAVGELASGDPDIEAARVASGLPFGMVGIRATPSRVLLASMTPFNAVSAGLDESLWTAQSYQLPGDVGDEVLEAMLGTGPVVAAPQPVAATAGHLGGTS